MHEVYFSAFQQLLADGENANGIFTTLIITAGTVITGAFGLIIALSKRDKTPTPTPAPALAPAPVSVGVGTTTDQQRDWLWEQIMTLQGQVEKVELERDQCKAECETMTRDHEQLLRGIRRRGLSLDDLMKEGA